MKNVATPDFETGTRVLNQLFAAQSMLHIFPDAEKMEEFAAGALKIIPGVNLCSFCLNGYEKPLGDLFDAAIRLSETLVHVPFKLPVPPVQLPYDANRVIFPLITTEYSFGYVLLTVSNRHDFQLFEPAVNNFINMIAVHLENMEQRRQVKLQQQLLEEKINERTAELQKSETKFRTLFETMTMGVVYQEKSGNIILANPAAEKILGLTLDQMMGRTSTHPEWRAVAADKSDLPGEEHPAMIALKTGKTIHNFVQGIYNPAMKDYVWILVNSIPLFQDGDQEPYQVYSTFLEITESKLAEEIKIAAQEEMARLLETADKSRRVLLSVVEDEKKARVELRKLNAELEQRVQERTEMLQISERNYRDIFETSPVSIWKEDWTEVIRSIEELRNEGITDFKAYFDAHPEFVEKELAKIGIIDVNETTLTMFEAESKEQVKQSLNTVFSTPDVLPGFVGELIALAQGIQFYEADMALRTTKKQLIQVLLRMVFPEPGSGSGIVLVTLNNITLRKKAEAELEQSRLRLLEANKELETFTYSVSHDLKAPLRGIDGYSNLLMEIYGKELNDEAKHFILTIRNSTLQMNQLIEDLLQYSRLERSQRRNEMVNIRQVVDLILKINDEEILAHNFRLENNVPDISVFADSGGIQIALRNLIGNAIKFTKSVSHPTISLNMNETPHSWVISVSDNGVGFDMKYHQRIFEIFQRLHRAEDYPGTGIGLAMVSKAMQRMNGRVWAESEPGKGATFYLEVSKPN